ncbi:MAG TPA: zf-HC2 domain-containing protein [Pyrinomonadaceae bacterium]|nr:zf-HC2 domain-containing protein [Pyrinomonadaceae bacterium]
MRRCLDEGLLQAYLDGELSQEQTREAAAHVAACESCAAALAEAEGESAFFATAFAPDDSVRVPSEVLRSRISAAVAQFEAGTESRTRRPGFGGFLATLSALFTFTPQKAAAFASLLAVVALAVIYFAVLRQPSRPVNSNQGAIAKVEEKSSPVATVKDEQPDEAQPKKTEKANEGVSQPTNGVKIIPASARRTAGRRAFERSPAGLQPKAPELLPGEKEYQTAIASLEKTIRLGGDATLRPAVRVKYERDLALLDSAITETRRVAAENPKDKDAVGFLMSVYQSKVELLTKVADQAQVAALGR